MVRCFYVIGNPFISLKKDLPSSLYFLASNFKYFKIKLAMKTIFISAIFTGCCGLFATHGFAQQGQPKLKNNEVIIIRKNVNNPAKTIIEIDSNKITINGQPLADYKGDVTVLRRNFMGREGNHSFIPHHSFSPRHHSFSPRHNFSQHQRFAFRGNSNTPNLGVLSAKADKGVVIKNVVGESAAQKAGLKDDDIITKFGDKVITSPDDLRNAVRAHQFGDKVTLSYLRDGKNNSAEIVLGKTSNIGPVRHGYNMGNPRQMMTPYFRRNHYNYMRHGMYGMHGMHSMQGMNGMEVMHGMNRMHGNNFHFNHNHGSNNRERLGLKIQDTENANGAKILNVGQGSVADKAGLKTGDIITQINGTKINDANDVSSQIMESQNKNDYKIKVNRENKEMNIEVHIPKVLKSINV